MEQPIENKFENLSLSSEPIENELEESIISLPSEPTEEQQFQNIRISISSRFLNCLDQATAALVRSAKGMHLMVWGPYMLPTRVVNITTGLTPSPEGFNLECDSELQYHGRVVDVLGSSELVEQMMSGVRASHVNVEVEVVDLGGQIHVYIFSNCKESSSAMEEPGKEKIRVVMSSRSLKAVDEVTAQFVRVAKSMCLKVWGPCRAPTQVVDIKTRLTPCSKGLSPYGNFKLRVYGTTVDVLSSTKVAKEIVSGLNAGEVEIEIIVVKTASRRP
ncbi:hypothetical protein POM88_038033 [Heracleum sosnowskyi]|uniref:Small ribosomal subunit protein uS10 domain-containing protein n=1 Tax=Heracleum sosnowskyi TaxID=360622 RepID=A0AAD8MFY5_9APIA|nr:hypothetical protein POM88_038033 [Heracleum sosnowskyi]